MKGFIYSLVCPIINEPRYVGQTTQKINRRFSKHIREIDKDNGKKNNWLRKIRKLGKLGELKIEVIEEVIFQNNEDLDEREIFWISEYKKIGYKLTNIAPGGKVGSRGYKHSKNAKKKISDRSKLPRKEMSDTGKKNISKSLIGNNRHTGHKHSNETKDRISKLNSGKSSWNKKKVIQLDLLDNIIKIWESSEAAAKELKISQGNILSVCYGKRKTCSGFKWKQI